MQEPDVFPFFVTRYISQIFDPSLNLFWRNFSLLNRTSFFIMALDGTAYHDKNQKKKL